MITRIGRIVCLGLLMSGATAQAGILSAPQLFLPANSSSQDWRVVFAPDNLSFYVLTERDGHFANTEIYGSVRPDTASAWPSPGPVPELNSNAQDHIYWVSQDQTEAYMARHGNPAPSAFGDIYRTTRTTPADPWETPQIVSELSGPDFERQFHLTADGLCGIFSSNRSGSTGGVDFWEASRSDLSSPWSIPTFLSELSSPLEDRGSQLSADGLTLYFSRLGEGLFRATRLSRSGLWSDPEFLGVAGLDPTLSPDQSMLYYTMPNGSEFNYDIYSSTIIPEPSCTLVLACGAMIALRRRS